MSKHKGYGLRLILILVALVFILLATGSFESREPSKAFGGNFGPMAQQQMGKYQIAGRDASSAWVIDTAVGDVFIIYADGKWKDVGSIFDERKQIKK
jgi:hypothetical protein